MTTPSRTGHAIGAAAPRADALGKVTGAARYTADVVLPAGPASGPGGPQARGGQARGTVWGKVLRSPYPHARIVHVDATQARTVSGVHAVLTGADLPPATRYGRRIVDVPVLAQGVVRFIGEPVAAVAADDEDTAQRALDLIEVEYEELPAVFDPLAAMAPLAGPGQPGQAEAVLLHPDVQTYSGLPVPLPAPSNVVTRTTWGSGNVVDGMAQADLVVERTYTTPAVHQAYLESHTCLVDIDEAGRVQVWTGNKAPYNMKQQVAACIRVPQERIRVNPVTIGGDFGGKGSPMYVPLAYFLAKASGRPVRIVMDYTEELLAGNPRHASITRMRMGAKRDGTITAMDVLVVFNSGAYAGFKPVGFLPGASSAGGAYHIPHAHIEALGVYTNTVPAGHMRGPGEPQAVFASESHMDVVARELGMDPVAFRKKNLLRDGDANPLGHRFQAVRALDTLDAALDRAAFTSPKPPHVGRGVAVCERAPGGGETHAAVTLSPDGSITVHTPIFEQGSGSYTVLQQAVAEELGLGPERVVVEVWDTDSVEFDSGVGGSRVTRVATQAGAEAARQAREALRQRAALALGWPVDQITVAGEHVRRTDTGATHPWADVLKHGGTPVTARADIKDTAPATVTGFTAQVAEVVVDPETGAVRLRTLTTAHDIGRVVNPLGLHGQINGGVAQGIGYALMEDLRVEDGRVGAGSFADFKIPTMADMPELRTVLVESDSGVGPYHTKGIGENPNAPTAAAIANAVEDAVGVRISDLPITAEKVYRALKAKRG